MKSERFQQLKVIYDTKTNVPHPSHSSNFTL